MTSSLKITFINMCNTYLSKLFNDNPYQIDDIYIENYTLHLLVPIIHIKNINFSSENHIVIQNIICKQIHISSNFTFNDINCSIQNISCYANINISSIYYTCDDIVSEIAEFSDIKKDINSLLTEFANKINLTISKLSIIVNNEEYVVSNLKINNIGQFEIESIKSNNCIFDNIGFFNNIIEINKLHVHNLENLIDSIPNFITSDKQNNKTIKINFIEIEDIFLENVIIDKNITVDKLKFKKIIVENFNNSGNLIKIDINSIENITEIIEKLKILENLSKKISKKKKVSETSSIAFNIIFRIFEQEYYLETKIIFIDEIIKIYWFEIKDNYFAFKFDKMILDIKKKRLNINCITIYFKEKLIFSSDLLVIEKNYLEGIGTTSIALSNIELNITEFERIYEILYSKFNDIISEYLCVTNKTNYDEKLNIYLKNCKFYYKNYLLESYLIHYYFNELHYITSEFITIKMDKNNISNIADLELCIRNGVYIAKMENIEVFPEKNKLKIIIEDLEHIIKNKNLKIKKKILNSNENYNIITIDDYIPTKTHNKIIINNIKIFTELNFCLFISGFTFETENETNRLFINNYVLINNNSKQWKHTISNMKSINSIYFSFGTNTIFLNLGTIYIYIEEEQIPFLEQLSSTYKDLFQNGEVSYFKSIHISEIKINLNYQPIDTNVCIKDMTVIFPKYESYQKISSTDFLINYKKLLSKNFDVKDRTKFLKHLNVVRPLKLIMSSIKKTAKNINDNYVKSGIEIFENIFEFLIK